MLRPSRFAAAIVLAAAAACNDTTRPVSPTAAKGHGAGSTISDDVAPAIAAAVSASTARSTRALDRFGHVPLKDITTLPSGDTQIDFEGFGTGTLISTQFANVGVTFTNATILTMDVSLNPVYPPRSGSNVIYNAPGAVIGIAFKTPVDRAGGYVTSEEAVLLNCVDQNGRSVGTASLPGANYIGAGTPNAPLFVSGSGIVACTFTGLTLGREDTFTVDDFTFRAGCHVTTDAYSQGALPWGPTQYDNTKFTMQQKGCAVTSLAMALSARQLLWNPGALNTSLKAVPGRYFTRDGSVIWNTSAALGGGTYIPLAGQPASAIDTYLCQGMAVIVGVELNANGVPGHFVTVVGRAGADYDILDPDGGEEESLIETYGTVFALRGAIAGGSSRSNMLALLQPHALHDVLAGTGGSVEFTIDDASLALTDDQGATTGIALENGVASSGIPGSSAWADRLNDDLTGAPATGTTAFVQLAGAGGSYATTITPQQNGVGTLLISSVSATGAPLPPASITILGAAGQPVVLSIAPSADGSVAVVRAGGFGGARQDARAALVAGLIKNDGILQSILQSLDNAEAAWRRGDQGAARNILNALSNKVSAQTGPSIDPVAGSVLNEDVSALLALVGG